MIAFVLGLLGLAVSRFLWRRACGVNGAGVKKAVCLCVCISLLLMIGGCIAESFTPSGASESRYETYI